MTAREWRWALDGAGLRPAGDAVIAVLEADPEAPSWEESLTVALSELLEALNLLALFEPFPERKVRRLRAEMERRGASPPTLTTEHRQETTRMVRRALQLVCGSKGPFCEDRLERGYGRSGISDGIQSGSRLLESRLLGAFHGEYDLLTDLIEERVHRALRALPHPYYALRADLYLLIAPDPQIAVIVARGTGDIIRDSFASDPDFTAQVLGEMRDRTPQSATSSDAMSRRQTEVRSAASEEVIAEGMLDIHRRMLEGQLRPSAWALLRLAMRARGRMPELGGLRRQLQDAARVHPVMTLAASIIEPPLRNTSAHEDYIWDADVGQLLSGDGKEVSLDDLEERTQKAYSFMLGVEVGVMLCMGTIEGLFDAVEDRSPTSEMTPLCQWLATRYLGSNGLHLESWSYGRGELTVVLRDAPQERANHILQAVLEISDSLPQLNRLTIRIAKRTNAVSFERPAIEAAKAPWRLAVGTCNENPSSTFLALNHHARSAVETTDEAANAVAYLAASDLQNLVRDFRRGEVSAPAAQCHLAVMIESLRVTMALGSGEPVLRRVRRLCMQARTVVDPPGGQAGLDVSILERELDEVAGDLIVPDVMPGLIDEPPSNRGWPT